MLSPISFTSTFKVNNQNPNTEYRFKAFKNFADKTAKGRFSVHTVYKKETVEKSYYGKTDTKLEETLIVPDSMDSEVQAFCMSHGIKFEKLYSHDLLDLSKITSRIQEAPRGYKKVNVNPDKLEQLIKDQKTNIPSCQKEYYDNFGFDTGAMIKEGSDFPATTLRINPIEEIGQEQMVIDFVKSEENLDCYTYFALKNLGLDKIPVYVDDLTYKAGFELGLFN